MSPLNFKSGVIQRFLKCIDVLRHFLEINRKYKITESQAILLNYICEKAMHQSECRVMEIIYLSEVGSQATLYKNLKLLIERKLVDIHTDKIDMRMKTLTTSTLALKRLKELESFV